MRHLYNLYSIDYNILYTNIIMYIIFDLKVISFCVLQFTTILRLENSNLRKSNDCHRKRNILLCFKMSTEIGDLK